MKGAIVFLFVALSCYFGPGNAGGVKKGRVHACDNIKGPGFGGGVKQVPSTELIVSLECLVALIQVTVPAALLRLQEMLCCFVQAKKEHNMQLYKQFLCQVRQALKECGCTADQLMKLDKCLEKTTDEVGKVAHELGCCILKLVEELGVSDIVMNCLCDLLGETLLSLHQSLRNGLPLLSTLGGGSSKGLLPLALPLQLPIPIIG